MKTLRGSLEEMLQTRGILPDQATAIMDEFVALPQNDELKKRWGDAATDYDNMLLNGLWQQLRPCVVEWIDKNKPQHWARRAFLLTP